MSERRENSRSVALLPFASALARSHRPIATALLFILAWVPNKSSMAEDVEPEGWADRVRFAEPMSWNALTAWAADEHDIEVVNALEGGVELRLIAPAVETDAECELCKGDFNFDGYLEHVRAYLQHPVPQPVHGDSWSGRGAKTAIYTATVAGTPSPRGVAMGRQPRDPAGEPIARADAHHQARLPEPESVERSWSETWPMHLASHAILGDDNCYLLLGEIGWIGKLVFDEHGEPSVSTLSRIPKDLDECPGFDSESTPTAPKEWTSFWKRLEQSSTAAGLYTWDERLYLLGKEEAAQDGATHWSMIWLDPESGIEKSRVQLPTEATHLAVIPGDPWTLIEISPVEGIGELYAPYSETESAVLLSNDWLTERLEEGLEAPAAAAH